MEGLSGNPKTQASGHTFVGPPDGARRDPMMSREEKLRVATLTTLDRLMVQRTKQRRSYAKLLRTVLFVALYILVLFMQREPTRAYQARAQLGIAQIRERVASRSLSVCHAFCNVCNVSSFCKSEPAAQSLRYSFNRSLH